jgi:hypothetical protein
MIDLEPRPCPDCDRPTIAGVHAWVLASCLYGLALGALVSMIVHRLTS